MKVYTMRFLSISAISLCTLGCTQENTEGDAALKAEYASGANSVKADGSDPCARYGWYGDGVCDSFCPNPDPDCEEPEDPCTDRSIYVNGVCDQACEDIDPECEPQGNGCPPLEEVCTTGCCEVEQWYLDPDRGGEVTEAHALSDGERYIFTSLKRSMTIDGQYERQIWISRFDMTLNVEDAFQVPTRDFKPPHSSSPWIRAAQPYKPNFGIVDFSRGSNGRLDLLLHHRYRSDLGLHDADVIVHAYSLNDGETWSALAPIKQEPLASCHMLAETQVVHLVCNSTPGGWEYITLSGTDRTKSVVKIHDVPNEQETKELNVLGIQKGAGNQVRIGFGNNDPVARPNSFGWVRKIGSRMKYEMVAETDLNYRVTDFRVDEHDNATFTSYVRLRSDNDRYDRYRFTFVPAGRSARAVQLPLDTLGSSIHFVDDPTDRANDIIQSGKYVLENIDGQWKPSTLATDTTILLPFGDDYVGVDRHYYYQYTGVWLSKQPRPE